MQRWLLIFATGCAGDLTDATRYAEKAMAIVDVVGNEGAREYRAATLGAVVSCRDELGTASTPESREACLRRHGFAPDQIEQVRDAFEELARAYDCIAESLATIREVAPVLRKAEVAAAAHQEGPP